MAAEFSRVARSGLGLDDLTDSVLRSSVFDREDSPTFLSLLMVAFVAAQRRVPEKIVNSFMGVSSLNDGDKEAVLSTISNWNELPPESREGVFQNIALNNLRTNLSGLRENSDNDFKIRRNLLDMAYHTYTFDIAQLLVNTPKE